MNKRDYHFTANTQLPRGYVVIRKCRNCEYRNEKWCTNGAPMPDPLTCSMQESETWFSARRIDFDGRCDEHEYLQQE